MEATILNMCRETSRHVKTEDSFAGVDVASAAEAGLHATKQARKLITF